MTRIVIDDVDDRDDLHTALFAIWGAFEDDPGKYRLPVSRFFLPKERVDEHGEGRGSRESRDLPIPVLLSVPCSRRGEHDRVTDCASCWADVKRGFATEAEVLTSMGLESELRRLACD